MAGVVDQGGEVPGYTVPLHRALSEPILLGGAPRAIAIMNGTLAGAIGLGLRLWLVGLVLVDRQDCFHCEVLIGPFQK